MIKTIDKDDRHTKTVFSRTDNIFPEYSKFPLGEDFYNIETENPKITNEGSITYKLFKV